MVKEIAVEALTGGQVVFIEVEAKPRELLDQAIAITRHAGLTVSGVEQKVEAGQHIVAYRGIGKAMKLGEQDAILGDDQRLVAIAIVLHPLAEGAHTGFEGFDVAMFGQGGGAGDRLAGEGFEARGSPAPQEQLSGRMKPCMLQISTGIGVP